MDKTTHAMFDAYERVEILVVFACFAMKMSRMMAQEAYAKAIDSEFVEVAKETVIVTTKTVSDIAKTGLETVSENLHIVAANAASSVYVSLNVLASLMLTSVYFVSPSLRKMTSLSLHTVLRTCLGNLCVRKIHTPGNNDMDFWDEAPDVNDPNWDFDWDFDWDLVDISMPKQEAMTIEIVEKKPNVKTMMIGEREIQIIYNYF